MGLYLIAFVNNGMVVHSGPIFAEDKWNAVFRCLALDVEAICDALTEAGHDAFPYVRDDDGPWYYWQEHFEPEHRAKGQFLKDACEKLWPDYLDLLYANHPSDRMEITDVDGTGISIFWIHINLDSIA